ncbi:MULTISPECIES: alpha/beta hydrolase [unclassified Mesorhizobium]|uniref:alpha/beta hydrolase n=1 Tax=unclassified Mesorhizobium TaxID=325217 RepID=UPI001AED1858|nr:MULTISPECIES: alpha/beta hydrolase [unclassified Mesorhizobium]
MERRVEFKSSGYTIRGVLTRPDGAQGDVPLVVLAGGWCYTKEIVLPHYAKAFLEIGCATLAFDYRNFGESEGDLRQNLNPWEQIEDIRNAVSFAETLEGVDPRRIGLMGISYAGGHAIITGAIEPRLAFVISAVPVVDGYLTLRRCHGEMRFAELLRLVAEDRNNRYAGKAGATIPQSPKADPAKELTAWPFPHIYSGFMAIKEKEAPLHEHWTTIESVEWLLRYQAKPYAERIYETPVLVAIAKGDNITSSDLEIEMFNAIPCPNKTFVSVGGVDHMSLYTKPDHLERIGKASAVWLKDTLSKL